jgi:hypothetical protein
MTPQEEAKELVLSFYYVLPNNGSTEGINSTTSRYAEAKQCAMITVDRIINCDTYFKTLEDSKDFTKYWYEVQQEIERL